MISIYTLLLLLLPLGQDSGNWFGHMDFQLFRVVWMYSSSSLMFISPTATAIAANPAVGEIILPYRIPWRPACAGGSYRQRQRYDETGDGSVACKMQAYRKYS